MPQRYATDAELLLRIPATATASADQRAAALEDAAAAVGLASFVDQSLRAHALYAAHLLATEYAAIPNPGGGGLVSSRSAGEISVSYAVAAPSSAADALLMTSSYGRAFLMIRDSISSPAMAV
jgi:hypothetical protein